MTEASGTHCRRGRLTPTGDCAARSAHTGRENADMSLRRTGPILMPSPSAHPIPLSRWRAIAPALMVCFALAACADDKPPPPAATLSPGQSPNASAYDSTATTPMGSEAAQTAPTVGSQPMAPAPLPQTATSSSSSNKPGSPSIDQGAGGILLPVTAKFLIDRP